MITNPSVPVLTEAVLIDRALNSISGLLESNLNWLDTAYGRCEKMVEYSEKATKKRVFPGVYVGGNSNDYLDLLPDSLLGCYSFFHVKDGEEYLGEGRRQGNVKFEFGLVVWFDYRKVYPSDWKLRSVENVKKQVVDVFRKSGGCGVQIQIGKAWVEADNIYKGFTHEEIDRQFLIRPYGGFRIDGIGIFSEKLNLL